MSNVNFKKALNTISYIAIVFAAIALVVGKLVKGLEILMNISYLFAFIVAGVNAFYFAKSKRSPWYMVIFVICAIAVVTVLVLNIINV